MFIKLVKLWIILSITEYTVNAMHVNRGKIMRKYWKTARSDPYPKPLRALHNPQLFSGDIFRYRRQEMLFLILIGFGLKARFQKHKGLILDSMNQFSQHTCIKFRERLSDDKHYLRIFKGSGCYATIGKDEDNPEMVSLGEGCYFSGTIVHELMHTVGFYHEQNRSDRDDYITIHWQNINELYNEEFKKLRPEENQILTPFDYNSIMLYGPLSFSKDGQSMTMQPKHEGFTMKEVYDKPGLTAMDAKAINLLYKCP
ncbi:unnamed protein product [Medioppia subpectinata]|uniref:Metalloendopeptidase n=1 Tax=Medioppia subpectinata TaxID=1979941 RepID=A0A7R9LK11_9ACAR|nr:unnamed protein product [Medioppia subpectinata]CAG2118933.1 unnamed protein product [Medioppia subpectinata]